MKNEDILDILRTLFLLRGYTLHDSLDQSIDIVVQNDHHSQNVSIFHLKRQLEQFESPSQKQLQKCIHSFVDNVCEQFKIRESEQKFSQTHLEIFPFLRNRIDNSDPTWYVPFADKVSSGIQFPNTEDLVWHLVHNQQSHVKILNVFDFSKFQLSLQSAWQQAIKNLRHATKPPEDWGDGWFCFHQNDGFDSTRLLVLEDFINVKEKMVFATPCRDLLAVAPLSHRIEMSHWAIEYFHSYPYPISEKVGLLSPSNTREAKTKDA